MLSKSLIVLALGFLTTYASPFAWSTDADGPGDKIRRKAYVEKRKELTESCNNLQQSREKAGQLIVELESLKEQRRDLARKAHGGYKGGQLLQPASYQGYIESVVNAKIKAVEKAIQENDSRRKDLLIAVVVLEEKPLEAQIRELSAEADFALANNKPEEAREILALIQGVTRYLPEMSELKGDDEFEAFKTSILRKIESLKAVTVYVEEQIQVRKDQAAQIATLVKLKNELEAKITSLEEDLNTKKNKIEELTAAIELKNKEIETLTSEKNLAISERDAAQGDLEKFKIETERERQAWKKNADHWRDLSNEHLKKYQEATRPWYKKVFSSQ